MRNEQVQTRNNGVRQMTSAVAIQSQCQGWVRQMALPLVAERRVKGALDLISRDSGVSYSKLRKIYYGLTDHILAYERERLRQARERDERSRI